MALVKQEVRDRALAAVRALSLVERLERGLRAQERLLATPEFRAARTVMAYQSGPAEVATHEIILTCLNDGRCVGLPRTEGGTRTMKVLQVRDVFHDLEPSRFGRIKEPVQDRPAIPLEQLDLVIVPGAAFDATGRRMGRGAGYYDRFLSRPALHAVRMALCFECQIISEVPWEPHDQSVDLLVTEDRVIRPG